MKDDKKQSIRQEKTAKWRKFAKKRWVYPAVYLAFAALVVASVLWMQGTSDSDDYAIDNPNNNNNGDSIAYESGEDAVPVTQSTEEFVWPVKDKNSVHITKQFYDVNASPEEQQAALVYYNNTYRQNMGINIASESGKSFAVTAAMGGTVIEAKEDSLVGYVVKIDHGNDVVTLYQSLKEVAVEKGDKVEQGEKIGMAGRNTYNKNAGVHLHFEIRKNGEELNPVAYFGKTIADLPDTDSAKASEQKEDTGTEEEKQSAGEEESPTDSGSSTTESEDKSESESETEDSAAQNSNDDA